MEEEAQSLLQENKQVARSTMLRHGTLELGREGVYEVWTRNKGDAVKRTQNQVAPKVNRKVDVVVNVHHSVVLLYCHT